MGDGVNPITFTEIDAYARLTGVPLSPYDVKILRSIDETVVADARKAIAIATQTQSEDGTIPANNPQGVKALFEGLKAKKGAASNG